MTGVVLATVVLPHGSLHVDCTDTGVLHVSVAFTAVPLTTTVFPQASVHFAWTCLPHTLQGSTHLVATGLQGLGVQLTLQGVLQAGAHTSAHLTLAPFVQEGGSVHGSLHW